MIVAPEASRTRHRIAILATLLLAGVIAWLTLTPKPPAPELNRLLSDKHYHAIAFAALVLPSALLYARSLVWMLPLAALFGGAIEVVQPYMGRDAEAADLLADVIGIGVGTLLGLVLRRQIRRVG